MCAEEVRKEMTTTVVVQEYSKVRAKVKMINLSGSDECAGGKIVSKVDRQTDGRMGTD